MALFPNVSIKRKQMLIIMLTSSAALLLACAAFVSYELFAFRQQMKRDLSTLADRISDKAATCIAGEDRKCAADVLRAVLQDEPNIVMACLYKKESKWQVDYRRQDKAFYSTPTPAAPTELGFQAGANTLTLARPVGSDYVMGTIYLQSDLRAMYVRLLRYAGIVAVVLLLSSVVAFVLSARLQRVISDPVIHLAQVSKIVSQKKNYAIRAAKYYPNTADSNDELNQLIDGFNEMLAEIQVRDAELEKAREELEKRVGDRTRDLLLEVTERTRAEKLLQQQFARISLLNQITHSISERLDLKSVLMIVLKQLQDHLPADFGAVFVTNPAGNFVLTASTDLKKASGNVLPVQTVVSPLESGFANCLNGKLVQIADASSATHSLIRTLANVGLQSVVAAPLIVEDKLFGVLLVARTNPNALSEGESEFLQMLSEQVALAAHQARLHTELQGAYNELRQTQNAVMQQQRLRALGEMASGIAHDINNALSPIIVYSELLLRNERFLGESSKKHLNNIKTAGEDIAHIVARMREFYRRRDDNEQLVSINLNQLAEQVVELTRPRWRDIPQQKGIVVDMQVDFDPHVPSIVGIPSELREAITNLILNAVDAMPAGGILTIRTRVNPTVTDRGDLKSTSRVALEICDNGIGMDEETRTRCLEPFFSTKGQRGTGLGLAMVYGIMERHDGDIEVDSSIGKGTVMRLIFPVRTPVAAHLHRTVEKRPEIAALNILCIDDEPLLRQLMQEILESDGHTVSTADGGQDGIEAFRSARRGGKAFDVVITDLGMPYVDGRQVACVIKKESPITPIILLTGWGTMMKADGDAPTQVDAVISKPPRMNELRDTLIKVTTKT